VTLTINPALGGLIGSRTRQELDGVEYRLTLLWLAHAPVVPFQGQPGPPPLILSEPGVWSITVAQADGTVLPGAGQILRHGVDVLAPFGDPVYPGGGFGRLIAWDETGAGRDPGRDDLDPGSDVRLIYVSASEALG